MQEITYGAYGEFQLQLGGKTRTFRFPIPAIREIEKRFDYKSILLIIQDYGQSLTFLHAAICAGLQHEFVSKRGWKEGVDEAVNRMIDGCEEVDGLSLDELMVAVANGVLHSIPGMRKHLADVFDEDGDEEGAGDEGNEEKPEES